MFPRSGASAITTVVLLLVLSWTVYDAGSQFGPWSRDAKRLEESDVVRLVETGLNQQIDSLRGAMFNPVYTQQEQYAVTSELATRFNALQEKPHWRILYGDGVWTVHTGVLAWRVHDRTLEVEAPSVAPVAALSDGDPSDQTAAATAGESDWLGSATLGLTSGTATNAAYPASSPAR